jgi:acetyltransferase-like isoleucine patch superfamily enzyme
MVARLGPWTASDVGRVLLSGLVERWRRVRIEQRMRALYPQLRFERGARAVGACEFAPGAFLFSEALLRDTSIGAYSYVGSRSRLTLCRVGAFCSIGPGVLAGLGRHPLGENVSTHPAFYSLPYWSSLDFGIEARIEERAPVVVGNDVWIGERAILLDGACVADGAVVAAGALVSGEVPPYAVVGGVPARVLRRRFDEPTVAFLSELRWWSRDLDWIRRHAAAFMDIAELRARLTEADSPHRPARSGPERRRP